MITQLNHLNKWLTNADMFGVPQATAGHYPKVLQEGEGHRWPISP
jgi:hypothetical protein